MLSINNFKGNARNNFVSSDNLKRLRMYHEVAVAMASLTDLTSTPMDRLGNRLGLGWVYLYLYLDPDLSFFMGPDLDP